MDNALILVAEDEPEIAAILTAYLERDGFRTVCAADGETALMHHQLLRPDLVLLDVQMPKRDGFAVLAEVRRRGNTSGDHGHCARRGSGQIVRAPRRCR